jgi:hypothetical protein
MCAFVRHVAEKIAASAEARIKTREHTRTSAKQALACTPSAITPGE